MRNALIVLVAAGLVTAAAVVEGVHSNRWGATDDGRLAAEKLQNVPRSFGSWTGADTPLDVKVIRVAEAVGNVSRVYQGKNGERISVLLLCGPTGPIGAHTPDVCYAGLGYSCRATPTPRGLAFDGGSASFWTARFEKASANDEPLLVYWGWGVDGNWAASANPRTEFALRGSLYKLYLVRSDLATERGRDEAREPIEDFLKDFLPRVKAALAPPAS